MDIACSHPGEHLAYELEALNMSGAELALHVHVPSSRIRKLIEGREPITGEMALRLAHFFGTSARFWMNLQVIYELRVADHAFGQTIQSLPTLTISLSVERTSSYRSFFSCISRLQTAGHENRRVEVAAGCPGVCSCVTFSLMSKDILIPNEENPLIWINPERMSGAPCFFGTRLPVSSLFENLEDGVSIDEWLDAFSSATREQAIAVLEYARNRMLEPVA